MSTRRIEELDGLRGIAAMLVVIYHYTFRFAEKFDTDIITKHFNFKYGHYGVELFFIISGFVIFMSIDKIKSPFEFVYKRFVRLYPTFWFCMILTFVIVIISDVLILKVSFADFLMNFTMLPSVLNFKEVDGVYWTLKIELFFYLLILFLLIFKKSDKNLILGFIYILIGVVSLLFYRIIYDYYYGLFFIIGINFYHIWKQRGTLWHHLQIFLCLWLTINKGDSILFISSAIFIIMFYLIINKKLKFISNFYFLFIGKISYALYLIHQNIGYVIQLKMIEFKIDNFLLLILIPIFVSIVIASIITFYIEKPVIAFLNNYYQKVAVNKFVKSAE